MRNEIDDMVGKYYRRGFRNSLIAGFTIVIVWALLIEYAVSGWGILAVNISFLIASVFVIGMNSYTFFAHYMRRGFATLLAAAIWVGLVLGLRSLISAVL